jgi:ketosteroid isomerase-like protein
VRPGAGAQLSSRFRTALRLLVGLSLAILTHATEPAPPAAAASPTARAISALLADQAAAWNRGDLVAFMAVYAPTDDLRFASGGTVTYGWRATLERYQQHYPDKKTMGTLAFTDLVITELAPDAALAFGRWQLTREKDAPHGLFTLTWKKTAAGWRIIHDHTSSAAP